MRKRLHWVTALALAIIFIANVVPTGSAPLTAVRMATLVGGNGCSDFFAGAGVIFFIAGFANPGFFLAAAGVGVFSRLVC
jgi:hypothetical protein